MLALTESGMNVCPVYVGGAQPSILGLSASLLGLVVDVKCWPEGEISAPVS